MVAAHQVHQHSTGDIPACTEMSTASGLNLKLLHASQGNHEALSSDFLRSMQPTSTCFVEVHIDALQLQVAVTLRAQNTSKSTLRMCAQSISG